MEKIRILVFRFPNGSTVNCVGSEDQIQDLDNYFTIQNRPGIKIDMDVFMNRIINNGVYCCFEPKGFWNSIYSLLYVKKLKKSGLWINRDLFLKALAYYKKSIS